MGRRLKGQLLALLLGLMGVAFVVVVYFNLSVLRLSAALDAQDQARYVAGKVIERLTTGITYTSDRPLTPFYEAGEELLVAQTKEFSELVLVEVLEPGGQVVCKVGLEHQDQERLKEALEKVTRTRFPLEQIVAFKAPDDHVGEVLKNAGRAVGRRAQFEIFVPIVGNSLSISGTLHVAVRIEEAPLRLRIVGLANIILALTFLASSLMAVNLWAEYAIHRPLTGLVDSMTTLSGGNYEKDFLSNNELVHISQSFHRMALDLVKYQRELEGKTRRLEKANVDYKALNEQLEQKVEEKTRDMKEFFSLVTHDLRIPLAAIQGYTDLLQRKKKDPLTERQHKFVKSIAVANSHALELVRNLLQAMKYEFGEQEMVFQELEVHELLDEIVSHLEVQAENKTVVLDAPEDEVWIDADRTRLQRVFSNLISNALRFTEPEGAVTVSVVPGEETVEFAVTDKGPGIPEEHVAVLFDKFTQFPSESGPSSGLGLGLYIVGKILEGHESQIEVESKVGEGTTFRFRLRRTTPKG